MNNLKKAYELGWIQASKWAEREDLIDDIGLPTYVREAEAALAIQQTQPQAEPLESLPSTAIGLLIGYEDGQRARGFRGGVASVSAGWISVDERLPEPDGPVLAYNGKWTGVAAWMSGEYLEPLERWQDEHGEFIEMMGPAITHWMPLPIAPGPADGESNG